MQEDSSSISLNYCQCGCGQRTPFLKATDKHSGAIKGQPARFVHGHNKGRLGHLKPSTRYIEEDKGFTTPCWIWQMNTNRRGYGLVYSRTLGRATVAHRVYYEQAYGPIPLGLQLDHLCQVKNCVNPEHLEPVTNAENQRRCDKTKLTLQKANKIRKLYASKAVSQRQLATQYDVDKSVIWRIIHNRTWIS